MTPTLTPQQTRAARVVANGLVGERPGRVVDVVRRVVGVQAQDARAARLQVRARSVGLTGADVDAAVSERAVVGTWAMRGTLHLLAAEDVRWIVRLLGPRFAARTAGRRRQLGLDDEVCARGLAAVRDVLGASGPMVRADLVAAVAARGVRLDPKSQAPAHLVSYAAMQGLLCRGPAGPGGEPTYVLLDDWVATGEPLDEQSAAVRLAQRYLAGFGPAAAEDFAAWSGLPLGAARQAFDVQARAREVQTRAGKVQTRAGKVQTRARAEPAGPSVRLLGHFDTYLLGYRGRELAVPPEFDRRIQSGGGFIMPAVLVDGRAVGTWRQQQRAGRLEVSVQPFTTLAKRVLPGLRREVADLDRFLETDAVLVLDDVSWRPGK